MFSTSLFSKSINRHIVLGTLASVAISLLSFVRGWPFPSLTSAPWFFQQSIKSPFVLFLFTAAFIGMLWLLVKSWLAIMKLSDEGQLSTKTILLVFSLWVIPILFSTPLFSGDVYVYYVDGQVMLRGFDLYKEGISAAGAMAQTNMVHMMWRDTNTMYGPLFMKMAEWIALISPENIVGGILLFRVTALASVVIAASLLAKLASYLSKNSIKALAFALLNPLSLFHLIGGAHNDAMMVALVMVALYIGVAKVDFKTKKIVVNLMWCSLALAAGSASGAFKLPGFASVLVLGWIWAGVDARFIKRIFTVGICLIIGVAWFQVQTVATGLSWGWRNASDVPGLARPLLSVANAFGVAIGGPLSLQLAAVSVARGVAYVIAIGGSCMLILRTHKNANANVVIQSFGISLMLIGLLSPAVYPWYLSWGAIIVGSLSTGLLYKVTSYAVCTIMFFVLPGGFGVLDIPRGGLRIMVSSIVAMAWVVGLWLLWRLAQNAKVTAQ